MKKGKKTKRVNLFEKHIDEQIQTLNTSTKREIQKEIDHFQDREWKDKTEMHKRTPLIAALEHPEDHAMPKNRREFLKQGLLGTTLTLTAPSLLTSQAAHALTCPTASAAADQLPLLVIDCSAGASFMGVNITPSSADAGGVITPLDGAANLANFGLPPDQIPSVAAPVNLFGAGSQMLWHPLSVIGSTMRATATQAVLDNVDGITVACASDDDTTNNVLNISQAVVEAGFRGSLAGAIGTSNRASGGRSQSLLASPGNASTQVEDQAQAQGLVNPGNLGLGLGNSTPSVTYALRQIAALTELQSNSIKSESVGADKKTAISCGAQQNIANLGAKDFSQMYNDPMIQTAFGGTPTDETDMAVAAGAYLALKGEIGVATVEIGGCDYHAVGANGQIAKDQEIGRAIGTAMRMASLNTTNGTATPSPIAVLLITDGSASANGNDRGDGFFRQNTENGNFSSLHLFVYNPAGRPAVIRPQFGVFGANGVDQGAGSPAWATNPPAAAQVMAANYMYLAGKVANVGVLGNLPAANVSEIIGFGAEIISSS